MLFLIIIRGVVQGVGFRPTVYRIANAMGLHGYVLNKGSHVEIVVDERPRELVNGIARSLPPLAKIAEVDIVPVEHLDAEEREKIMTRFHSLMEKKNAFHIVPSTPGDADPNMPADTALCHECVGEMLDPKNRRYLYPFTNCTNCGARFTVIHALPYDRDRTSMHDFEMCKECLSEYSDPNNRRFHAQTISCPNCGPEYTLFGKDGKKICSGVEAIKTFAKELDKGSIGILKQWGGMNVVAILEKAPEVRNIIRRERKPLAIMVKDISTAKKYAYIDDYEENVLVSKERPIVLLRKRNGRTLENISPGLDTVGIMLPYSAIGHLLFHFMEHDAIIATSANPPGEPMFIDNSSAFKIGVDYYLLHNRRIVNRCDDSVLKVFEGHKLFIRKSRGYVPSRLRMPIETSIDASVGIGAGENVTVSLLKNGIIWTSQYIGDSKYYGTQLYLKEAYNKWKKYTGIENVSVIGADLHPRYATVKIANEIAEMENCRVVRVQHHWAHAVSLMVDHGIEEVVCLTLDGTGYGEDGNSWGGEVLHATFSRYSRLGSLYPIPLIGGETAVIHPKRIAFAWMEASKIDAPLFDDKMSNFLRKAMKESPLTTSMGRYLDAISAYFGVCSRRTYEGEPAMMLEPYLRQGRLLQDLISAFDNVIITMNGRKVVDCRDVAKFINDTVMMKKYSTEDIIYTAVYLMIASLVKIGAEFALEKNIEHLGISGGVAYNIPILQMFIAETKRWGLKPLIPNNVPPGDCGISIGQCAVGACSDINNAT
ncbi:MAG: carbamoyltransferase HypF [Thermoplasmata archaeon]|nr:MAG: carbamoyltransferase HypF [Thermoplasmata archaeon]